MYCRFYGLAAKPFKPTPDLRYLYLSPGHREALATILYNIHSHHGIVALEGEVGTGKTTVLKAAIVLIRRRAKTAFIFNPHLPFRQIFAMILYELNLLKRGERLSKAIAIQRLNHLAIRQMSKCGSVVIFIDEAHLLSTDTFENLRLLTNLESDDNKLIQIVLAGQPELLSKLQRPDLRQFNQRVARILSLGPLTEIQTYRYIQHRMRVAGHRGPALFNNKALKLIWRYSNGVPRLINKICENALLFNYVTGGKIVPALIIREVAEKLGLNRNWFSWPVRKPAVLSWLKAH